MFHCEPKPFFHRQQHISIDKLRLVSCHGRSSMTGHGYVDGVEVSDQVPRCQALHTAIKWLIYEENNLHKFQFLAFQLAGIRFMWLPRYWRCYLSPVLWHFDGLSAFGWSVLAKIWIGAIPKRDQKWIKIFYRRGCDAVQPFIRAGRDWYWYWGSGVGWGMRLLARAIKLNVCWLWVFGFSFLVRVLSGFKYLWAHL